jgi:hypothetical protein
LSQLSHVIRTSVEFNDEEDEDESTNIDDIIHRHGSKTSAMNDSYRHNIEMLSDANLPTQVLSTDEHLFRGADRKKDGLGSLEVLNEVSVFTDLNTRMGFEENNKNLSKDEEIDKKAITKHDEV